MVWTNPDGLKVKFSREEDGDNSVDNLSVRNFNIELIADAVQADDGSWSGTDNAPRLAEMATENSVIKLPPGDFYFATPVWNRKNISNVDISGVAGRTRFIFGFTGSEDLFNTQGTTDDQLTTTIKLTANATAFSRTLTVNDTSSFTEGQWIIIRDNSQPVLSHDTGTPQVAILGEANRIQSIDSSTQVTLAEYTKFDYNLYSSSGTTIRRFTDPADNIRFADLVCEWDQTLTYGAGAFFNFTRTTNLILENLRFVNALSDQINMTDVIGFRIDNVYFHDPDPLQYSIKIRNGCSGGIVNHPQQTGGRHMITTATTTSQIEPYDVIIRNGMARGTSLTAYDLHPGSRDFLFDTCYALGGGDKISPIDNLTTGHGVGAGFQIRGRRCTVINPRVDSYYIGVHFVDIEDSRLIGGEFDNCDYGVRITNSPRVEIINTVIRNPIITGVHIVQSADPAGGTLERLQVRARVEGNPSTAAAALDTGTQGADWVIDVTAPDATTVYSNLTEAHALLDSSGGKTLTGGFIYDPYDNGTVSSGNLLLDATNGVKQTCIANGAFTLLPPIDIGDVDLEISNGASAGAITTTAFNATSGDAYSTTAGKKFLYRIIRTANASVLQRTYLPDVSFYNHLIALGLTTNLKLCLDAGDAVSYPGVGTDWVDLSGGSPSNFGMGAAGAAPTFNGVSGALTSSEYFSFDGGDYFTYNAANAAWMKAIHKDSAAFTFIVWGWFNSFTAMGLMGTDGGSASNVGWEYNITSGGTLQVTQTNGSNFQRVSDGSLTATTWMFSGVSFNESTGAVTFQRNASTSSNTATYTSPSASDPTYTMQIGAAGNNALKLSNLARLAGVMVWDRALTATELNNVYNATKGRFGL